MSAGGKESAAEREREKIRHGKNTGRGEMRTGAK